MRSRRILQLAVAFGILVGALMGRLVQLQIVQHDAWEEEAIRSRTAANDLAYRRGRLLDRRGKVLAEDAVQYDLVWQYRDFRRDHVAGQILEVLSLLGADAGGLTQAFDHGEALAPIWLAVRPRTFALLGAREREDLAFYLKRLAGLDAAERATFAVWSAGGGERSFGEAFPRAVERHAVALERARADWDRLEAVLGLAHGGLMPVLEQERQDIESAVQRRVLKLAAARALGLEAGSLHAALRDEAEGEGSSIALLERLSARWRLPAGGQTLARLILESEPPEGILPTLRAVETASPQDVAGLRRLVRFDLHRSRTPVVQRGIAFPAVDLLVQEADAFPGFEVKRHPRRGYPEGVAPQLVGGVSLPTEEQARKQRREQEEFRDLARIFERTPEQERRFRALKLLLPEGELPADEPRGAFGAEAAFDARLRGRYGKLQVLKTIEDDGAGPREIAFVPAHDGEDVRLTLDASLMRAAESAMRAAYAEVRAHPQAGWSREVLDGLGHPRCGFALLDLEQGGVPVLATLPTFTPEEYRQSFGALRDDPDRPLMHRALGGNYEARNVPYPGSTFKPLVALAALRQDPRAWSRVYECAGSYAPASARGGRALDCDDQRVHGMVDMEEALVRSCNVYFYKLAEEVGYAAIHDLAAELGFGAPTGIEIGPGAAGLVPGNGWNLEYRANLLLDAERARDPYNVLRLGIGQVCVTASPLQMARFYGWLATGRLLVPRLGRPVAPQVAPTTALAPEHQRLLAVALRSVVEDPRGTAHDARWPLERFRVAGKTGTAQVAAGAPVHAWFTGWFPHDQPRYAFAIYCENAGVHGGDLAAVILYRFLEACWDDLVPAES